MRHIGGPGLRRALIGGVQRVIADRETLNRINVFSVADGDTGSNLSFTLASVLSGALSQRIAGAGELMRRVSEEAIDGGRGNSGAILGQFLTGIAANMGDRVAVAPHQLALAVRAGARAAREAVSEPREGTMFSVITAFAEALEHREEVHDIKAWFAHALAVARNALAYTPQQLPVLLKAGVVDAGAQGFVDLLQGIGVFLGGESTARLAPGAGDTGSEPMHAHLQRGDADPTHRWCSECLLLGEHLELVTLRAPVAGLDASCAVVAGSAMRPRTLTWAMAADLGMVVRGGRLPAWSRRVADLLGLTPIARIKSSGKLGMVGGLFGRRHLIERFARYVTRQVDKKRSWRLIVGHCDALSQGELLLDCLRQRLDCRDAWLVETGPAIGAHAGPGTLVVSLQPAES